MQRNINDIFVDLDFLARGLSYEAQAGAASSRRQRTEAADRQRGLLTELERIAIAPDRDIGGDPQTRAEWLRRQQDLIESLADEITCHALESCRALDFADTNANVSALCEFRDADLRHLVSEVTRRGEQLKNRLARDRAGRNK